MFKKIETDIDREIQRSGFIHHYKMMIFFLFNRFDDNGLRYEGKKYVKMRHYFAMGLIKLLGRYIGTDWKGKTFLDVGGATGDFCSYVERKTGALCTNLDADKEKINRANFTPSIWGSGADMKFTDSSFDIVISRGVIEHVPIELHKDFVKECFRVMKPAGIGYLSSSPWFAPWAGHQLAPFHVFPIKAACFLTNLFFRTGYKYKAFSEADLYYLSYDGFMGMLTDAGFKIRHVEDPITRLNFFCRLPVFREVFVQHMAFVVEKPDGV